MLNVNVNLNLNLNLETLKPQARPQSSSNHQSLRALLQVMSLRRSVIGSLRSVSPFINRNDDQIDSVHRASPAMSVLSTFSTPPVRYATPSMLRRATTTSPTSESGFSYTTPVIRLEEVTHPRPPSFDRGVDLIAMVPGLDITKDRMFDRHVSKHNVNAAHPLFKMPSDIKRRIYGFCFPDETRKLNLSPSFATKAVFPEDYFACPWDVLDPVWGGLEAFSVLRFELLIYFWTHYHFHVTLNEFSGPIFSPLSHVWILRHLDKIQHLTMEVDFTRFGCSQLKDAKKFGYNMEKTRIVLATIIAGLSARPVGSTIAQLHLMCRRYDGCRLLEDGGVEQADERFCPDDVLEVCDSLMALRGIAIECRLSGFTLEYSEYVLNTLFGDGKSWLEYVTPVDDAWPFAAPKTPTMSEPPTPATLVSMEFPLKLHPSTCTRSFTEEMEDEITKYALSLDSESNYVLSGSYGLSTAVQPEGRESNIAASNILFSTSYDAAVTATLEVGESGTDEDEERSPPARVCEMTATQHAVSQDTGLTLYCRNVSLETSPALSSTPRFAPTPFQDQKLDRDEMPTSTTPTSPTPRFLPTPFQDQRAESAAQTPSSTPCHLATPLDQKHAEESIVTPQRNSMSDPVPSLQDERPGVVEATLAPAFSSPPGVLLTPFPDQKHLKTQVSSSSLRPQTPTSRPCIPRASTDRPLTPRTPNKMNALNEQDPAFVRTLEAMRSLDGTLRRSTMIALPKRSPGNPSEQTPAPSKRRYLSFVYRLRGISDT
ncbi:alpha beta hydrolase fold protein [Diplocarpon rosae]|nr:alpha beta hydrolase fold protein [Diplocarpon rosae]